MNCRSNNIVKYCTCFDHYLICPRSIESNELDNRGTTAAPQPTAIQSNVLGCTTQSSVSSPTANIPHEHNEVAGRVHIGPGSGLHGPLPRFQLHELHQQVQPVQATAASATSQAGKTIKTLRSLIQLWPLPTLQTS